MKSVSKKVTADTAEPKHLQTRLTHAGRPDPRVVSSPVFHASTVLFANYAEFCEREAEPLDREHMYYGRMGTPTTRALEDAVCELDGGVGAVLTSSGTASMASILNCFLSPGEHLLMVDSTYGPTRKFCLGSLARRGVSTTFYDPLQHESLDALVQPNTRMIFMESPGSATFEIQDVPAIVKVAKRHGLLTAIDNTWATPLLFNPLNFAVDLAMQSGTKYLNGHADCLFGVTTTASFELYRQLQLHTLAHGMHLAPDDAMLALRGMRTLPQRLQAHDRGARTVARWLETQARVRRLLHPAWSSCPGHEIFERDFQGANGLFGIVMQRESEASMAAFIDALELFGVGFSWGGFESLCLPMHATRSAASIPLADDEVLVRLHIGLEYPPDLQKDLARGFAAMDALKPAQARP